MSFSLNRIIKSSLKFVGVCAAGEAGFQTNKYAKLRGQLRREYDSFDRDSISRAPEDEHLKVFIRSRSTDFGMPVLDSTLDKIGLHHFWLAVVDEQRDEVVHEVGMAPVGGQPFDGAHPDPLGVETEWISHSGQPSVWQTEPHEWSALQAVLGVSLEVDPRRLIDATQPGRRIGRFGRDAVCLTAVVEACFEARVIAPAAAKSDPTKLSHERTPSSKARWACAAICCGSSGED